MSMTVLTILQFVSLFCAYSLVVVVIPAIVFRAMLKGRPLAEQFLLCLVIGNFFVMNLVFTLQLLHIANTFTLVLGTIVTAVLVGVKVNHIDVKRLFNSLVKSLKRIDAKEMGMKTVVYKGLVAIKKVAVLGIKKFYAVVLTRSFQWLWVFVIIGALLMIYGPQMIREYGYTASDVPVHIYWINAMLDNDIFVAGVYPFGFHCVVYYINQVFGMDVYVIMRVVALTQNIYVVLALLATLKGCCQSKYIPYISTLFFVASDLFYMDTYNRYYAPLPQEYGMMFILPAIYFGFKFFLDRKKELAQENKKKKESLVALAGFAMSFGMTLAVHFYGTMIAGIFCVAMAIGYIFLFLRKGYFVNIVVTCFISVAIAVLPMGIAFATGTPLQGSLGWGLSVITGTDVDVKNDKETESQSQTQLETQPQIKSGIRSETQPQIKSGIQPETQSQIKSGIQPETQLQTKPGNQSGIQAELETKEPDPAEIMAGLSFSEKLSYGFERWIDAMQENVLKNKYKDAYRFIFWCIIAIVAVGIVFMIFKRYCYGAMLVSVGLYMAFMSLLLCAGDVGLPPLMDPGRCSIYYAYSVPMLIGLLADAILSLVMWSKEVAATKNAVSFGLAIIMVLLAFAADFIKEPRYIVTLEMNEAVACLTNIIREEKDFTWTICSANDETQMGKEHGYHYETIDFLKKQEYIGELGDIRIPTETVYIFIEKRPLNYTVSYKGSGQYVSELGAMNSLPLKRGISMYQGEARWIVMSRMYYWAQEFMRMYPEDMSVYCETEEFVCYKVKQNTYSLYNFAIDYGYNTY